MKVKANWPVDTGKKVHQAGDKFDLPDDQAEQLERLGAVEIVARKTPAATTGEAPPGGGEGGESDGEGRDGGAGDGEPQP